MSRVLITGGVGALGAAVARRLLADPAFDVRISDERPAPQWMREGCEVHRGDLRVAGQATAATKGCSHVIHLACFTDHARAAPYALLEYEAALHNSVIDAALDRDVERLLFASSPLVFERAELFPTPEEHLEQCLAPRSAGGFARLAGERQCAAAHRERGLRYAICRPFGAYGPAISPGTPPGTEAEHAPAGPAHEVGELIERAGAGVRPLPIFATGEQTLTPTHVDDLAEGIVAALSSAAAANEDFNLAAARELSLAEIAQIAWRAVAGGAEEAVAGRAEEAPLERLPAREIDIPRSYPSVAKARELLGWEARIDAATGIAALAAEARERAVAHAAEVAAGD
ncbi:MAG: NAD-dependent epimerase/dehydratase family protein [Solirubrobacterales bacterium]